MGIEELEKLIADGIRLRLKGPELRMWVETERGRLKTQREEEKERLKAQREAERPALKNAHEKHLAELNRQIASLEKLYKRKVAEASLVANTMVGHDKLEDNSEGGTQAHHPRPKTANESSQGTFEGGLQQDDEIPANQSTFSVWRPTLKFESKPVPQEVQAKCSESRFLNVDDSESSEIAAKEAAGIGAAIAQTGTPLLTAATRNEHSGSECSELRSSRFQREPKLSPEVRKMRERKRKPKKEERPSFTTRSTNPKSREVQQSLKRTSRNLSIPFFLKRRVLNHKAGMLNRCKTHYVDVTERTVPRQPRAKRRQVRPFRSFDHRSLSSQKKPDTENPTNSPCEQRFYYSHKSALRAHDSPKTYKLRMRPRPGKLPGQLLWKYRRKEDLRNQSVSNGTTPFLTSDLYALL